MRFLIQQSVNETNKFIIMNNIILSSTERHVRFVGMEINVKPKLNNNMKKKSRYLIVEMRLKYIIPKRPLMSSFVKFSNRISELLR